MSIASKSDLCDLFEILISVGCRHLCTSLSSDPNFPRDSPAILARHVIRLLTIEFLCAKNRIYLVPVVTELIIKQVLMAVNNRLNLVLFDNKGSKNKYCFFYGRPRNKKRKRKRQK